MLFKRTFNLKIQSSIEMDKNPEMKCEECHENGVNEDPDTEQLGPVPEEEPEEYVRNPQYFSAEVDAAPVDEPIIEIMQHFPSHN